MARSSAVTKASCPPPGAGCAAFAVGKFAEAVRPTTYTVPTSSTPMSVPMSSPPPPSSVEYRIVARSVSSLVTTVAVM